MWVREVLFIILVNLVAICHVKRNVILASQELGEIDIEQKSKQTKPCVLFVETIYLKFDY